MIYMGIDPGEKGALAYIDLDGSAYVIPREYGYSDAIRELKQEYQLKSGDIRCCLEKINARNGESISSMFKMGKEVGYAMGVLEALQISYQGIAPSKWKKEFSLDKDKKKSIATAKALFPDVSLLRNDKCKVPDDNLAEALLMAEWMRRHG